MRLRHESPRTPWQPGPPPAEPPTPGAEGAPPWLQERMFDQRMVIISGPLTGPAASRAAAALLTLDAMGTDPVRLHLATPDGELTAAFGLIDVLDSMTAPVDALVTALTGGAAVGVLAASKRRLAYPHAQIRLTEPRSAAVNGTADEVAAAAGQYLRELEELALRVVAATGQPRSRVEDDMAAGRVLTAAEAREYGLIDEIIGA